MNEHPQLVTTTKFRLGDYYVYAHYDSHRSGMNNGSLVLITKEAVDYKPGPGEYPVEIEESETDYALLEFISEQPQDIPDKLYSYLPFEESAEMQELVGYMNAEGLNQLDNYIAEDIGYTLTGILLADPSMRPAAEDLARIAAGSKFSENVLSQLPAEASS